jgi:hypothetical protein
MSFGIEQILFGLGAIAIAAIRHWSISKRAGIALVMVFLMIATGMTRSRNSMPTGMQERKWCSESFGVTEDYYFRYTYLIEWIDKDGDGWGICKHSQKQIGYTKRGLERFGDPRKFVKACDNIDWSDTGVRSEFGNSEAVCIEADGSWGP